MSQQQHRNVPVAMQGPPPSIVAVDQLFKKYKGSIEQALPKHMTSQRMMRVALTELRRNYGLQKCDPMSFLGAVVQASQLGLEPGGTLGHCYLIPYGRECQLQLGYRGMIDIARRSGNIISISANIIYKDDIWGVEMGTEQKIKHVPAFTAGGEMLHVYAAAQLKGGGVQFDIMSKAQVEEVRDRYSQSYKRDPKNSPWATNFEEMAKKTVIRRLFKMLPTSIEIHDAIRVEEDKTFRTAHVLDPDYEVEPAAIDPERQRDMLADGGQALPTLQEKASTEADRKNVLAQFDVAVEAAIKGGAKLDQILGAPVSQLRQGDLETISAATDQLNAAVKGKGR